MLIAWIFYFSIMYPNKKAKNEINVPHDGLQLNEMLRLQMTEDHAATEKSRFKKYSHGQGSVFKIDSKSYIV